MRVKERGGGGGGGVTVQNFEVYVCAVSIAVKRFVPT